MKNSQIVRGSTSVDSICSDLKWAVFALGPPCGGKGEASKLLLECGFHHYSSSRALREFAKRHNRPDVTRSMDNAELVEIDVVKLVGGWEVQDFVSNPTLRRGYFDGWGRDGELNGQLTALKKAGAVIDLLVLDADDEELVSRAAGRLRGDDAKIRHRIAIYRDKQSFLLATAMRIVPSHHVHVVPSDGFTPVDLRQKIAATLKLEAMASVA